MFIGHFAVGFASKPLAPKANLGWLIAAPLFLDLIWPVFLLFGSETVRIEPGNTAFTPLNFVHYPISHSLATAAVWSVLFGLLYYLFGRYKLGALVAGIGVFTHWLLDTVVHRPDLPLYPGSETKIGFGLWNSIPATVLIEGLLFILGFGIYWKMTRPLNRKGTIGFWSFIVFLLLVYIGNILGPPPETVKMLVIVAFLVWIFPFWAAWFDRNRLLK